MVWEEGGGEGRACLEDSLLPTQPLEKRPNPRAGRKLGWEGLLYELLEGTDSEAAVAHVGVRGTLTASGRAEGGG